MNRTDKAQIAEDYYNLNLYATQLSNFVYNVIQTEAAKHAELMGPTVRNFDAARGKFNETLKSHGIVK